MGLDDRDYMRDRRRAEREAARLGSASWIDRKGRVEHDGPWFGAQADRNYRTGRYRPNPHVTSRSWQKWIFLLMGVSVLIPLYSEAQRKGWLPDFEKAVPFPETGSVTVPENTVGFVSKSFLTIGASEANAVVQLFDPETNRHALSIYVAANRRVTVPVPSATYRVRLIEGPNWHGTTRYFGPNTSYETVAELMTFRPRSGHLIDLHRRPDGNLKTRMMLSRPSRL